MRAAVLEAYGEPLSIESVPDPTPDPDGVVIETLACGICRSDWHAWKGHGEWADDDVPLGQILGHEPVGRVVEVGEDVDQRRVGERVVVPFSLGDGSCSYCRSGHSNVCRDGRALGFEPDAPGAFAERVHVPHADYNAIPLPDGVSSAAMAGLGCRFMTAFHALAHRARVRGGDWVAVHGCGGLGLSAVHVADALGGNVVAVDLKDAALEKAREVGAVETVNAADADVPDRIEALTDGGAHLSVDALGIAETCRNSIRCLRPRGRHVQLGLTTDEERGEISLPTDAMARWEIEFVGSRGMPVTRYDELFRMLRSGALDPEALITREVSLADVSDRLAAMDEYDTVGMEVVTEF